MNSIGREKLKTRMEFNVRLLKLLSNHLATIADEIDKLLSEDDLNIVRLQHIYISLDEARDHFETATEALKRDLRFLKILCPYCGSEEVDAE